MSNGCSFLLRVCNSFAPDTSHNFEAIQAFSENAPNPDPQTHTLLPRNRTEILLQTTPTQ